MAIEQFGEGLLARQRQIISKKERDFEKEQKRAKQYQLLGLGATIANNVLKERADNFMRSEQIMAQKALYKTAAKNAASILATQDAIDRSGMSAADYFYQTDRDMFEKQAQEYIPLERQADAGIGAYQQTISKEARRLSEERALKHSEAVKLAEGLVDREDFDSMIQASSKKARPTNVFGLLDSAARRAFSGKTRQEIDSEVFEEVKNSFEMQNVTALNAFMGEYNRSKNLVSAYNYGNMVVKELQDVERYEIDTTNEAKVVGNSLIIVKKEIKKDRTKAGQDSELITQTDIEFKETDSPDVVNANAVKGLNAAFNFATDGIRILNPEAWAAFSNEMSDNNISLTNIKTVEEYARTAKTFSEYAGTTTNVRNEFREHIFESSLDLLNSNAEEIQALLAGLEKDPIKSQELYDQLVEKFGSIISRSFDIATQHGTIEYTPPQ